MPHWWLKKSPTTTKRIGTKNIKHTPKEQEDEDFHIKHEAKNIINLIHVIKKSFWCKGMLGLVGFILTFLENICQDIILELF